MRDLGNIVEKLFHHCFSTGYEPGSLPLRASEVPGRLGHTNKEHVECAFQKMHQAASMPRRPLSQILSQNPESRASAIVRGSDEPEPESRDECQDGGSVGCQPGTHLTYVSRHEKSVVISPLLFN